MRLLQSYEVDHVSGANGELVDPDVGQSPTPEDLIRDILNPPTGPRPEDFIVW